MPDPELGSGQEGKRNKWKENIYYKSSLLSRSCRLSPWWLVWAWRAFRQVFIFRHAPGHTRIQREYNTDEMKRASSTGGDDEFSSANDWGIKWWSIWFRWPNRLQLERTKLMASSTPIVTGSTEVGHRLDGFSIYSWEGRQKQKTSEFHA